MSIVVTNTYIFTILAVGALSAPLWPIPPVSAEGGACTLTHYGCPLPSPHPPGPPPRLPLQAVDSFFSGPYLEIAPWFHGPISRGRAYSLLQTGAHANEAGHFLVRFSERCPQHFTLSYLTDDGGSVIMKNVLIYNLGEVCSKPRETLLLLFAAALLVFVQTSHRCCNRFSNCRTCSEATLCLPPPALARPFRLCESSSRPMGHACVILYVPRAGVTQHLHTCVLTTAARAITPQRTSLLHLQCTQAIEREVLPPQLPCHLPSTSTMVSSNTRSHAAFPPLSACGGSRIHATAKCLARSSAVRPV